MNELTAGWQDPVEAKPEASEPPRQGLLPTSLPHQCFTLISIAFICFEIIFLELYADNFWFSFDIRWLGVPAMVLSALFAHFFLQVLETEFACRWLRAIWKGKPPVVYRRWLKLDEIGITFGIRHVQFQVIDELELTFFGNLLISSRAVCGDVAPFADLLLKLPFGAATPALQKLLIERIKAHRPAVSVNKRLEKRVQAPVLKQQTMVMMFGVLMMSAVLLDIGQTSFYYLALLKEYHEAHFDAVRGNKDSALSHLAKADQLRAHPFAVSYVTTRFLNVGLAGSGLHQERADILWALGRRDEAFSELHKAIQMQPESFRLYLRLARFHADNGQMELARDDIAQSMEKHKEAFLARLYMVALAHQRSPELGLKVYNDYARDFQEETFDQEPAWPPGGNRYIHDIFYSEDLHFVFDRLLGKQPAGK